MGCVFLSAFPSDRKKGRQKDRCDVLFSHKGKIRHVQKLEERARDREGWWLRLLEVELRSREKGILRPWGQCVKMRKTGTPTLTLPPRIGQYKVNMLKFEPPVTANSYWRKACYISLKSSKTLLAIFFLAPYHRQALFRFKKESPTLRRVGLFCVTSGERLHSLTIRHRLPKSPHRPKHAFHPHGRRVPRRGCRRGGGRV